MDSKEFKNIFGGIAKLNGFEKAFGGWFKESSECIVVLDLQQSHFGSYYNLNIKVFVQGVFGNTYIRSKDLVKKQVGDIFMREPNEFTNDLDFEKAIDAEVTKSRLDRLFGEFIVPTVDQSLSRLGLKELAENSKIFLLPAVKEELLALTNTMDQKVKNRQKPGRKL